MQKTKYIIKHWTVFYKDEKLFEGWGIINKLSYNNIKTDLLLYIKLFSKVLIVLM